MSDFKDLQKIVQRGTKATESLMNFYSGINELLQSLQNTNLHNVSINLTIQDLIIHFPNYDANVLQYFLKKQSVKKHTDGEKAYYTLSEILLCFDFLFQSLGAPKNYPQSESKC